MKSFKEAGFKDRLGTAATARQKLIEKFKDRPADDDPAVAERKAQRQAIAEARAVRGAERLAAKEAEKVRLAEEAVRAAAEKARLAEESAKREIELEKERKAARDARYARRKAKK